MSPRYYRQARRAESAVETRRRIVEATFALHAEQGIAATSMKQIAARAGVSVGTVYHHFPALDDAIQACGQYTVETYPRPDERVLDGLNDPAARLAALVSAVFAHYAQLPIFERARCDQHLVPALQPFLAEEEANRRRLIALAFGPSADRRRIDAATALTDASVRASLVGAGWSTEDAAAEVARIIAVALSPT